MSKLSKLFLINLLLLINNKVNFIAVHFMHCKHFKGVIKRA